MAGGALVSLFAAAAGVQTVQVVAGQVVRRAVSFGRGTLRTATATTIAG